MVSITFGAPMSVIKLITLYFSNVELKSVRHISDQIMCMDVIEALNLYPSVISTFFNELKSITFPSILFSNYGMSYVFRDSFRIFISYARMIIIK